ncbi:hypothetical protein CORT_0F02110 [Candida orthopsilosis Co 90-125]|uniref:Uncharacterized protein n=1 Tax=Candida orthopsilosis (strain 90-125) TaxID=1136231 RepID=H8X8G1_CANO9|nr:hypothetical protein CORT_0F02110 [Candida orthopsilosis Co 90-125]CCG24436.1 hypothetical protein CORT_0F02110 [Candida orthopsilosis Co 90-125]
MTSIDNEVNLAWFDSYISYTKLQSITPDERILEKKQKQESTTNKRQSLQHNKPTTPNDSNDISKDAPNIVRLVESQGNSEELTQELKNILIKYYWAGFELHNKLEEANTTEIDRQDDVNEKNDT